RLLVGEEFLLGRVIHRVDRARLEATNVAHRPFSLPISLHPKFARALLNLSRVPMAGFVLDPFCGTGGLLLEAVSIGLRPIGLDRDRRMILGFRASLRGAGDGALGVADAGRLPLRGASVHGIATDPPYGRAAWTWNVTIAGNALGQIAGAMTIKSRTARCEAFNRNSTVSLFAERFDDPI